jgi:hypothetical protein
MSRPKYGISRVDLKLLRLRHEISQVDSKTPRPRYVEAETEISFRDRDELKIRDVGDFEEASRKVDNVISDNIRDGDFGSTNSREGLKTASVNIRDPSWIHSVNDRAPSWSPSANDRDPSQ